MRNNQLSRSSCSLLINCLWLGGRDGGGGMGGGGTGGCLGLEELGDVSKNYLISFELVKFVLQI